MAGCQEITLTEIMSDPIVLMMMQADGVDPREFEHNLLVASREHNARHEASGPPVRLPQGVKR